MRDYPTESHTRRRRPGTEIARLLHWWLVEEQGQRKKVVHHTLMGSLVSLELARRCLWELFSVLAGLSRSPSASDAVVTCSVGQGCIRRPIVSRGWRRERLLGLLAIAAGLISLPETGIRRAIR